MRAWLRALVPVYRVGSSVRDALRGRPRALRGKVVSVGSLSAGGAGKTPVVMLVVEMLQDAGFAVDVLSRGYRREDKGIERVDAGGSAARFGDEPMLMARRSGVPVWVGADRYQAGLRAEASGADGLVHVLDDGFQHRGLKRDADVVLLTRQDIEDMLLPAGNLREEAGALARADLVVLREDEADVLRDSIPAGKPVWIVRRRLRIEREIEREMMVFSGIARPEGFVGMLREAGVRQAGSLSFRDHHRYEMRDVEMLAAMAQTFRASGFVTTEKDAVKLTREMREALEAVGPLVVARLDVELVEGSIHDLLGRLR